MAKIALIGLYDSWMLGLRNIANALNESGHNVSLIHFKLMKVQNNPFYLPYTTQYQTVDTIASRDKVMVSSFNTDVGLWNFNELMLLGDLLKALNPDIIGFSTRSVYEKYTHDIIEQIKKVDGAITVAGGHDASFRPEVYLDDFDYVCVGEGEDAIVALAEFKDRKEDHKKINNLVYKEKGKVVYNPMKHPNDDSDHFFSDKMDKVQHFIIEDNRVQQADALLRNVPNNTNYYYTMVGRGCTGRCSYCSAGHFQLLYTRNGVPLRSRRMRRIENVLVELEHAKESGFREITFLDSFLIAKRDYLLAFFDAYQKKVRIPFFAQLHPEQILKHPEILDAAINAGMTRTVLGIQSGSERINKQIFNRKTPHRQLLAFADQMVGRGNLRVDYHLVTHNPFDTENDVEETLQLIKALPKKNASLYLFKLHPFVNTEIERLIKEANFGEPDRDTHDKRALIYLIRFFSKDDQFNKINSDFNNQSFDSLKTVYANLKRKHKSDVDLVQFGKMSIQKNDYQKAEEAFSRALELNPNSFSSLYGKGRICAESGRLEESEHFFICASAQCPTGFKSFWKDYGDLLMKSGRAKDAIPCYETAKEMSSPYWKSEYGQILTKLGFAHLENGNVSQSKSIFEDAIDYKDGFSKAQVKKILRVVEQKIMLSEKNTNQVQLG